MKTITKKGLTVKETFHLLELLCIKKFFDLLTYLTKYFPFSLISENQIFHYKNKGFSEIKELFEFIVTPEYLEKDEYFFRIYFNKRDIDRKEVERRVKGKDVFVSETEDNLIKISIPRK